MNGRQTGASLIEVLVACALLVTAITMSTALLAGLQLNPRNNQTLTVTQASARWLEGATTVWGGSAYGTLTALSAVPDVPNTTWSAQACTVAADTGTATCGAAVATGLPRYDGGGATPASTVSLVRLNLTYTPVIPGTTTPNGTATTTSLEFVRP